MSHGCTVAQDHNFVLIVVNFYIYKLNLLKIYFQDVVIALVCVPCSQLVSLGAGAVIADCVGWFKFRYSSEPNY